MIEKLIEFSIRKKYLVLLLTLLVSIIGLYSASKLSVDAVPDVTNVQVEIGINEFVVSKINFNTDTIICRGEVVNLGAPPNFQSYKWSTGEDKSSIQVRSGTYTLTVTDVNGCNVNSSITIKESPTIQYNAIHSG